MDNIRKIICFVLSAVLLFTAAPVSYADVVSTDKNYAAPAFEAISTAPVSYADVVIAGKTYAASAFEAISTAPVSYADVVSTGKTYAAPAVAAVSTNLDTYRLQVSDFNGSSSLQENTASTDNGYQEEISGIRIDDAGNIIYQKSVNIPVIDSSAEPADQSEEEYPLMANLLGNGGPLIRSVGDTMLIKDYYPANGVSGTSNITMSCIYVGTYCSIWICPDEADAIKLSEEQAKELADSFDNNYDALIHSFGTWIDKDKDEKLAIFCYDIQHEYKPESTVFCSSYIGGFYTSNDLVNNNIDCIHIDSYPGMGSSAQTPLSDLSSAKSTLIHETQHLINASSELVNENSNPMETFINEAFSMAAEHIICGSSNVNQRIDYFNGSSYVPGSSLTYWCGNNSTPGWALSSYSNSYLFGQYIRTRYKQLQLSKNSKYTGDGGEVYKLILDKRNSEKRNETLRIIADIFDECPRDFIIDFWTAVYAREKDSQSRFGFAGEPWADAIAPKSYDYSADSPVAIYNGGVIYYNVSSKLNVTDSSNLVFVNLDKTNHQYTPDLSESNYTFTYDCSEGGSIRVTCDAGATTLSCEETVPAGKKLTVEIIPDAGCTLSSIWVDNNYWSYFYRGVFNVDEQCASGYAFYMPDNNQGLHVSFVPIVDEALVWDGSTATSYSGGSGTKDKPYLISTASDLAYLLQYDANTEGKYYLQTCDIYLNNPAGLDHCWTKDAKEYNNIRPKIDFKGHYNGADYSVFGFVSNVSADNIAENRGLFKTLQAGASAENIHLEYCYIRGVSMVGGIAGINYGTIQNCSADGVVTAVSADSVQLSCCGGIAGLNCGIVKDCVCTATVHSGAKISGGICGAVMGYSQNIAKVSECVSYADIYAAEYSGGITGATYASDCDVLIESCAFIGNVNSDSGENYTINAYCEDSEQCTSTVNDCVDNLSASTVETGIFSGRSGQSYKALLFRFDDTAVIIQEHPSGSTETLFIADYTGGRLISLLSEDMKSLGLVAFFTLGSCERTSFMILDSCYNPCCSPVDISN